MNRSANSTLTSRLAAGLTSVALVVTQLTFPPRADAAGLGSSTASAGSAPPPSISAIQSFQPDLFTGRATTAIPLAVPPGRKGLQPSLALAYSSSGRNGWLGVGWSLDVGYIERSTKNGVPKYDTSDTFAFLVQGVTSELVQIPDGTYRAKDEGAFLRVENKGVSGWEVRDKSGTRYFFGQTVASQIESTGQVFRWALDKVLDPNGNTLTVTYTKDQGQLYPAQIDYTGHEPTSFTPTNQVLLTVEDRPDKETSSRSGFPVTTTKRLKTIETKATVATVLSLARRYTLAYTTSARTSRSLLTSITQFGTDGTTSLPPTTFTYTQAPPTYLHCHNCVPGLTPGHNDWQVQVHTGNLFPRDDANDQRLWPSGGWEPGVKTWGEEVCQRRFFRKKCQTVPRSAAIPSVSWSRPFLELSGSSGGVSWSTDVSGNLSVSGPQDSHLLAMTWLYTSTAKTVSLSSIGAGGRADVFYVSPGSSTWSAASGNQVPLSPGWTVVALTAYNEMGSLSLSMSANLATQVAAMNHLQFGPMGLAGDFNGDGFTDLAHLEPADNHWHVILNSSSTFGQEQTWLNATLPADTVPLVGDVDSDGKADLILWNASSGLWQVAKSTGSSFTTPTTWQGGFGGGATPFMGDFNGDGFLDVGTFSNGTWTVALSTGSSFGSATTWLSGFGSGATPLTGDFNGDGLTDVAVASGGTISVALSDGARFASQPSAWLTGFGAGQALTSADLNGDGLTDLLYYDKATGAVVAAFSTGQGFGAAQALMSDHPFGLRGTDDTLQVGDFRGNGLSGFGVFNPLSGAAEIAFALGTPPDLLQTTANGIGGTTTLTYQPSSLVTNTTLPFAIPVVTQTATADGLGHTYTTTYRYAGGLYNAPTKEFRGFQTATVTDAAGTTTTTTFSQDLHTKGRPLAVEVRDSAGRLFTKTTNTWSCTEPFPGVHFTKLDQTDSFVYDGDDTFRQVRSRFSYDQYGNLIQTNEDGEVGILGDERSATTSFIYNTTAWILNKPALAQTLNAAGSVVAQRRFSYDAVGNLTKEEAWLNTAPEQWLATSLTYDAYGNVKTVTDALNRATTNTYDPLGTYLIQIQNTLGHTRQLAYDPRFGAVTSSTDQNGQTTTTEYDALGRVAKAIGPTDTAALPTISYGYDLSTNPAKTTVSTRIQSGQPAVLTVYTFTDGLGRTIQTRSPAEDPTKQIASGAVEFDLRGLVIKQWVSYLSAFSSSYVPFTLEPSASTLAAVSYAYDPIGRLIQTTDPDGSVTLVNFNDGETTTTLPNGTQTQQTVDAHGRLTTVEEVLSETASSSTTYTYDTLNNLLQVKDAKGNLTKITYDSLGRKLSMDDPDMGHWTYAYDAVDNLTQQTDARGVVTSFTYDVLNHLTQKNYTVPAGSGIANPGPVTYAYDDPLKALSKGKLTEITDGSGSSSFEYDTLGRLTKESKTIDGTTSTIQRTYDLLGRLVNLTYPDADVASYTYNAQGGIETVKLQQGTTTQTVVSDVTYNAAGQLTKIVYGNGTVSDYTYHPQTLRLNQLKTTGPTGTLQDFSYGFDPVGNVTAITDRVHTGTQTFQYDALNRLTQAVGSYGTSAYTYDAIGNMTSKEGTAMTYGLADGSKPHAVTATSDGRTLTYDANGNLISKAFSDSLPRSLTSSLFSYDTENRLVEVKTAPEETVTLTFKPGWNFFSLPVIPNDLKITAVFSTFASDFEQLSTVEPDGTSKHFVNNAKFDDFIALEYGKGYQLYCKNPAGVTLTLTGKLPTTALSKSLATGWHLLPAITLDGPKPLSWLLQGVVSDQVYGYNAVSQQLEVATEVKPYAAYYVNVAAGTWTPPLPRNVTTQFVYDGDGGRVKKITATGTTRYLGEAYEVAPDNVTTKYVFAGSLRVAAKTSTGALRFYHTDHLGSSNVVTNATGALVELNEHTPYGALARHEGTTDVAHKFTGQRLDVSTGLYFYNARYYDPQLGRFISPDSLVQAPADPQTLNRYSYVRNNPLKYTDPSGHFLFLAFLGALLIKAAIGAVVGAALNATVAAFTGGNVGKAALTGAVGGAILGAGAAVAGAWSGATALGRAAVMAGAGALGGTAGAAMSGQSLGQGAAIGAGMSFVGSLAPTPNIPWLGNNPLGGILNPVLNGAAEGALMGAGAAAIQGESLGQGAAAGAAYYAAGSAFNSAVGHAVGYFGSGRQAPAYDAQNGVFTYGGNAGGAITFGNVIFKDDAIGPTGRFAKTFAHELGHVSPQGAILGPLYIPGHATSLVIGGIRALAVSISQLHSPQPGSSTPFIYSAHDLSPLENYLLGDKPTATDLRK